MSARKRCSNCEKSVDYRTKEGKVIISLCCKATGEKIANSKSIPGSKSVYYQPRKCSEFLPRQEYANQFENALDKAMEMIEKGQRIKDIVDPI